MLPLVGILALGLLVLGVRLLFMTPGNDVTYPEPSSRMTDEPAVDMPSSTVVPQNGPSPDQIVAVPVQDGQETVVNPAASNPAQPNTTPKPESYVSKPSTAPKTVPSVSVSSGVWVVQIGAFTTRDAAETLARDARGKTYEAFIVKAEVGGKTYFRVRIGAGSQRSDAENLAGDLAAKGYPTLVTRQE
jgi:cell division septation protein DedD